jgi:hypothetical protein
VGAADSVVSAVLEWGSERLEQVQEVLERETVRSALLL